MIARILRKATQVKQRTMPTLQRVALQTGLFGHTNYTRFIILGRSRVGSNFLRGLLNSHSQIHTFGEIFQNKDEIGWGGMPGYAQHPKDKQLFLQQPVEFIEKKLFHPFPSHIAAVGFKIFYYHASDENWAPVWQYLQNDRDLKVLHIKRRNILKTHLSRQRAIQTDTWVNTSGDRKAAPPPVTLSYDDCLADFEQTRAWEEQYDQLFAAHDTMEIIYEELAANHAHIMTRVQNFLNVTPEQCAPQTYKQARQPLSQAIVNYKQLRDQFAGTPWQSFFTD